MKVLGFFREWRGGRRSRESGCRACGICCELYGHTLTAGPEDLTRWASEGRGDLLARVGCESALWFDPETGVRLAACPYLKRRGKGSARCAIHATKPWICKAYPTSVHGHRCVRGFRIVEG